MRSKINVPLFPPTFEARTLACKHTADRARNNSSETLICVNIPGLCPLWDSVSSRTCVNAVQYESTFLTVMTLRRFAVMPSRNNVTWKLIWPSNHSSKGGQPRSERLRPDCSLLCAVTQAHGSALSRKILTFIYTFSLKRAKKKERQIWPRRHKSESTRLFIIKKWITSTTQPSRRTLSDFNKFPPTYS